MIDRRHDVPGGQWAVRLPGVYRPQDDTTLLIEALRAVELHADTSVLDVCTGSGAVAIAAAEAGAGRVDAIDICRRAVWTARWNARLRGYRGVTVRRADAIMDADLGRFDLIVSNPPYVPTPPGTSTGAAARAWDAGMRGRSLLDPLCERLPSMLAPGGTLLIVQSEFADIDQTMRRLRAAGTDVSVAARRRIAFGPVLNRRVEYLAREGLLTSDDHVETIAVIRADRAVPAERSSATIAERHRNGADRVPPVMTR